MIWNTRGIQNAFRRSSLLIAYLALVTGCVIAFMYMNAITDRIEREGLVRAFENCQASNETRDTIKTILDELMIEERASDTPGQAEDRRELRESLEGLLQPNECPPDPSIDHLDSDEFIEDGP